MLRDRVGFVFVGALLLAGGAGPLASVCLRLDALGLRAPAIDVGAASMQQQPGARQQQGQRGATPPPGGGQRAGGRGGTVVMTLTTTGWTDGGTIALKYTQAGDEVSPPLTWTGAPAATASFVLIARDLDAMRGNDDTLHWLVWNIPPTSTGLPENVPHIAQLPDGTRQISATGPNYRGPGAPASGPPHHYVFELYALDAMLEVPAVGASPAETRAAVMAAMAGRIRGKAALVGLFKRTQ